MAVMIDETTNGATALSEVSNGADALLIPPFRCELTIQGTTSILFHRWNCEAVEEKGKAAKGSAAKKTDDLESYVYRCENGNLGLPGEYLRMSAIWAAKFRQDPRSPRKSAMDLYKAALVCETEYADLGVKDWDFIDQRRVVIQRSAITRMRPALLTGWEATFRFLCLLPQYIGPQDLHQTVGQAGQLIGLADFRPTYGRFLIKQFEVLG